MYRAGIQSYDLFPHVSGGKAPPAELFGAPRDERTQKFLRRVTDAGRL